jgi:hypothetical protein
MFLHIDRRTADLITVICLALLLFCLVERAARLAIAPATKLADGMPGHTHREAHLSHHGAPTIAPRECKSARDHPETRFASGAAAGPA